MGGGFLGVISTCIGPIQAWGELSISSWACKISDAPVNGVMGLRGVFGLFLGDFIAFLLFVVLNCFSQSLEIGGSVGRISDFKCLVSGFKVFIKSFGHLGLSKAQFVLGLAHGDYDSW